MKGRLVAVSLLFLVLFAASCKKEATPGIEGRWVSEAIYQNDGNGRMEWISPRMPYFITFYSDGRFGINTDVPAGGGTYYYERSTGKIVMDYDPTDTNPVSTSNVIQVEQLTIDKLLLASILGPDSKMQMIKY